MMKRSVALAALVMMTACAPRVGPLVKVVDNGALLEPEADAVVSQARLEGEARQARLREGQQAAIAAALVDCAGPLCGALARGELAIGMREAEVLAVTGTSAEAWETRRSGDARVMTARWAADLPHDAIGRVAWVGLRDGRVVGYTYHEAQGLRAVTSRWDATPEGRSAARAEALLREGDEYVAAGRLELALQRYDQADILRPGHPETTHRIAQVLDRSLRPVEAALRYRLFIHQLELERLRAEGEVAANIAEAIARAHQRIVVLERR